MKPILYGLLLVSFITVFGCARNSQSLTPSYTAQKAAEQEAQAQQTSEKKLPSVTAKDLKLEKQKSPLNQKYRSVSYGSARSEKRAEDMASRNSGVKNQKSPLIVRH